MRKCSKHRGISLVVEREMNARIDNERSAPGVGGPELAAEEEDEEGEFRGEDGD